MSGGEGVGPTPILLRALSLGAGLQSTTMALMAAHGENGPMPDYAIFADTGWEPTAVYDHLAWLMSPNVLPFLIHTNRTARYPRGSVFSSIRRSARSGPPFDPGRSRTARPLDELV